MNDRTWCGNMYDRDFRVLQNKMQFSYHYTIFILVMHLEIIDPSFFCQMSRVEENMQPEAFNNWKYSKPTHLEMGGLWIKLHEPSPVPLEHLEAGNISWLQMSLLYPNGGSGNKTSLYCPPCVFGFWYQWISGQTPLKSIKPLEGEQDSGRTFVTYGSSFANTWPRSHSDWNAWDPWGSRERGASIKDYARCLCHMH